jgi:hypothetical protein
MENFLVGKKRSIFVLIQESIIPRIANYTEDQKENTIIEVENFLDTKSSLVKFKISLFLYFLYLFSLVKFLKPIEKLSLAEKDKLLNCFCNSPIPIIRKGFWGISTLTKLSVYSLDFIQRDLGYTQPSIDEMKKKRLKHL